MARGRLGVRLSLLLLAGAIGLMIPPSSIAHAMDSEAARSLRDQGMAALEVDDFAKAIEKLKASYEESPDAELLYHIAQAYRLSGDPGHALSFYKKYLTAAAPEATNRHDAEARVIEMQAIVPPGPIAAAPGAPAPVAGPAPVTGAAGYPPPYPYPYPYPYPPPPPASPPPAARDTLERPARDREHRRLLAVPFLGVHSYLGDRGKNFGPGMRLGMLLGGRLGRYVSLDGEAIVDLLNPHTDATIVRAQLSFNPLAHVPAGPVEMVGGPKLGVGVGTTSANLMDSAGNKTGTSSSTYRGWIAGLEGGAFTRVSRGVSIGGLLAFELRTTSAGSCSLSTGATCQFNATGPSAKVLSLSAAALF
jgi:hypothetical protein